MLHYFADLKRERSWLDTQLKVPELIISDGVEKVHVVLTETSSFLAFIS